MGEASKSAKKQPASFLNNFSPPTGLGEHGGYRPARTLYSIRFRKEKLVHFSPRMMILRDYTVGAPRLHSDKANRCVFRQSRLTPSPDIYLNFSRNDFLIPPSGDVRQTKAVAPASFVACRV
jgi:hypothetical protein